MLDLMLRGGAIGIIAITAMILLIDRSSRKLGLPVAVFGLLISCYLVKSGPEAGTLSDLTRQTLVVGANLVPLAFTWLILELLSGPNVRQWPWFALATLTVAASFSAYLWPVMKQMRSVFVIALYLGLMWLAIRADRDDLVAGRRQFRRGFLALMASLGVIISLMETFGSGAAVPGFMYPIQAGAFGVLAVLFAWQTLRPGGNLLPKTGGAIAPAPAPRSDLIKRLQSAMASGAWQREGLSILDLATDLGVPEHRLRTAINHELGYRNFSAFINGHRIEAAKQALSDPAKVEVSILEIAFDCGFASLGPFNKAFRAQTGTSPRDFRQKSG